MVEAIRSWWERQTGHEDPETERVLIDAQRNDALMLLARLDAAERRHREREQEADAQ